jgi:hypothetical protein
MNEIFLSLTILILALELRRKDYFSPVSFFVLFVTINSIVFYFWNSSGWIPTNWNNWFFSTRNYDDTSSSVFLFFLLVSIFGYLIDLSVKIHPKMNFKTNKNNNLKRYLESNPIVIILYLLNFATLFHFSSVNYSNFLYYSEYLLIRDTQYIGIISPLIKTIHTLMPIIGIILSPLSIYYAERRRIGFWLLAMPPYLYCIFFTAALASRVLIIYFVFMALTDYLMKRKFTFRQCLYFICSIISYGTIFALRVKKDSFGIYPFIQTVISGEFLVWDNFAFSIYNFFTGGFVMAEAFQRVNLYYPPIYKLLSFSPLPSIIDGFSEVRHYQHRLFIYGPFSSFAEAYHFGWTYFLVFFLILAIVLYQTTKMWRENPNIVSFVLLTPFYYSVFLMFSYPIRSVFRWLILALLVAVISNIRKGGLIFPPLIKLESRA